MGISERKQREKQQRNTQILEAARSLFISKGFSAATMQDIADRAELGRRTLYMYFKTKDEIVASIALDVLNEVIRLVGEAFESGRTGRERLENVARCFAEYYRSRPGDFTLILNVDHSGNAAGQGQGGRDRIDSFLNTLTEQLSRILEAGIGDGSLRSSGADSTLTARTIVTSILGTLKMLSLFNISEQEREEQLVLFIKLITNSVIPSHKD